MNSFEGPLISVDSYDFSTLYTALPHSLIKTKLSKLIKWCFDKSKCNYVCCNEKSKKSFFSNITYKSYINWTDAELIAALEFLINNIFIKYDNKIYRQVIGIPMGTNCAPLIADLFLYCFESQFMAKIFKDPTKVHLLDHFNNTYRYLDDIFSLNNPEFSNYIHEIYPTELILNKSNSTSDHCPFLDLNINIVNGKLVTKIYDKRDDFSFPIVNFPFLDGDVPLAPSYGVYISQLVRFARVCSDVSDFNERNLFITEKLLHQGFRYHKIVKTFYKFYYKYKDLVRKFGCTRRVLVISGISHPKFYGNVVYKARKFHNQPYDLLNWLRNLLFRGYKLDTLIRSVQMVFLGKDISDLIHHLRNT